MLYVSPDSIEGQGLVARDDYEIGLAITAPPTSEMNDVRKLLFSICGKPWKGAKEAAIEVYDKIVTHLEPVSNSPLIVPEWLVSIVISVRNRCRLKRYQCELNVPIRLRDLVRFITRTTDALEKVTPRMWKEFSESILRLACVRMYVFFTTLPRCNIGLGNSAARGERIGTWISRSHA